MYANKRSSKTTNQKILKWNAVSNKVEKRVTMRSGGNIVMPFYQKTN